LGLNSVMTLIFEVGGIMTDIQPIKAAFFLEKLHVYFVYKLVQALEHGTAHYEKVTAAVMVAY